MSACVRAARGLRAAQSSRAAGCASHAANDDRRRRQGHGHSGVGRCEVGHPDPRAGGRSGAPNGFHARARNRSIELSEEDNRLRARQAPRACVRSDSQGVCRVENAMSRVGGWVIYAVSPPEKGWRSISALLPQSLVNLPRARSPGSWRRLLWRPKWYPPTPRESCRVCAATDRGGRESGLDGSASKGRTLWPATWF